MKESKSRSGAGPEDVAWGWRVWRAFEDDVPRGDAELWKALASSCRNSDGTINVAEFERWCEVFVGHRWGDA